LDVDHSQKSAEDVDGNGGFNENCHRPSASRILQVLIDGRFHFKDFKNVKMREIIQSKLYKNKGSEIERIDANSSLFSQHQSTADVDDIISM